MLELRNITFGYTPEKKVDFLLQNFNMVVAPGEFLSLVGPSGCGKTTIVNIVAGYQKHYAGQVIVDGHSVTWPGKDRIVINQEDDVFEWMTVWDNLRIVTSNEDMIRQCLQLTRLDNHIHRYPRELSGGMKKRLSLARALVVDSQFIIMDEPFGSLDAHIKDTLHEEVLKIVEQTKKTVLLVTHDIEEAVFLSDRVLVLADYPLRAHEEIHIPFARPRSLSLKDTAEFNQLKHVVRKAMVDSSVTP